MATSSYRRSCASLAFSSFHTLKTTSIRNRRVLILHAATMSSTPSRRSLNIDNINPHVKEAQYAVRGELAIRSEKYRNQLSSSSNGDKKLPFDSVISANIGNPQQLDQKPITFFRQVISILENPLLLKKEQVLREGLGYESDVIERARWLLKDVKSVGAYSQSQGAAGIRGSVAKFIESECSREDSFINFTDAPTDHWLTIYSRTRRPPCRPQLHLPHRRRLLRRKHPHAHHLRLR